ncbi:hypothetical protein [uncultured Adlercreutzia sp.]|jgi:hypothetical protein|uniref:hypothetical protein n=2 Tax=Bacteria TaxID=2 RepID=UPI00272EC921|nr:hypothetical protein [uncultured Adlercreutzia sp.]
MMNGYYDQDSRVEMRTCPVCGKERAGDWFRGACKEQAEMACWKCRALRLDQQLRETLHGEGEPEG